MSFLEDTLGRAVQTCPIRKFASDKADFLQRVKKRPWNFFLKKAIYRKYIAILEFKRENQKERTPTLVLHYCFYWLSACLVNFSKLTLGTASGLAASREPFELVSCSRACRSSFVRVLERMGRKGAGEPDRDVRNWSSWLERKIVYRKTGKLTELAALSKAIKLAWTTSWWIPTPQTCSLLPAAVHWM